MKCFKLTSMLCILFFNPITGFAQEPAVATKPYNVNFKCYDYDEDKYENYYSDVYIQVHVNENSKIPTISRCDVNCTTYDITGGSHREMADGVRFSTYQTKHIKITQKNG